MVQKNPHLRKLRAQYLFHEIAVRKQNYINEHPDAKIVDLGIGNTTLPIPPHITGELEAAAAKLGTPHGYKGYGAPEGQNLLREKVATVIYGDLVEPDDVFISDGAKCDLSRLQLLFGSDATVAIQDPSYPVYIDNSVLFGRTGEFIKKTGQHKGIIYLPCTAENQFFPNVDSIPKVDLIYICSPNNPTGTAATKEQLEKLVAFANENQSIILFDAAYSAFIQDPQIPKSIYEIKEAKEVAIEINSFSKIAGFAGVRLGWATVPKQLKFEDGSSVREAWIRVISTVFNGASNIVQSGGVAILDPIGWDAVHKLVHRYMDHALKLSEAMEELGHSVYGGTNAPYIWVQFEEKNSWDVFDDFLENHQIITTPGVGFGPHGEGYIRMSAFAGPEQIDEAISRLSP